MHLCVYTTHPKNTAVMPPRVVTCIHMVPSPHSVFPKGCCSRESAYSKKTNAVNRQTENYGYTMVTMVKQRIVNTQIDIVSRVSREFDGLLKHIMHKECSHNPVRLLCGKQCSAHPLSEAHPILPCKGRRYDGQFRACALSLPKTPCYRKKLQKPRDEAATSNDARLTVADTSWIYGNSAC